MTTERMTMMRTTSMRRRMRRRKMTKRRMRMGKRKRLLILWPVLIWMGPPKFKTYWRGQCWRQQMVSCYKSGFVRAKQKYNWRMICLTRAG